jgi:hypothetical protein
MNDDRREKARVREHVHALLGRRWWLLIEVTTSTADRLCFLKSDYWRGEKKDDAWYVGLRCRSMTEDGGPPTSTHTKF